MSRVVSQDTEFCYLLRWFAGLTILEILRLYFPFRFAAVQGLFEVFTVTAMANCPAQK